MVQISKKNKKNTELRKAVIKTGVMPNAEGSAEISFGNTRVICTASVEDGVPSFLRDTGRGWVTAEYGMLPRSTNTRKGRNRNRAPDGRSVEIQRLIGRSLRAAVDLNKLGEYTVFIDCDVIQADGGTRTASITGAYVALADALRWMKKNKKIKTDPLAHQIAAISVGIVDGRPCLDLCYKEDVAAEVDFNVVMVDGKKFVEVQGTAEHGAFDKKQLDKMLALAQKGIRELMKIQDRALRRKQK